MERCPVHGTEITTGGCITCRQLGPTFQIGPPVPASMIALDEVAALKRRIVVLEDLYAQTGRAYEAWCLDVARHFIECAKRIAEREGEYAVRVPMKGGLLDLKWVDVEVDDPS